MIVLLTITPLVAALVLAMVMPSIVRRWTTPKVTRLVPRKQAPPPAIDSHVALAVLVLLYLSACEQKATIRTEECDPAMREWILQCIEKSSPCEDPEGAEQCESTATRLFCGPTCFVTLGGAIACYSPVK